MATKRGVRIPWIKDSQGEGYDRSEIDRLPHPRYVTPLKCGGCGCRVGARHGNAEDPDGRTSHYFKIEPHKPSCKYDLDQRGKQLVEGSASTVVRRAGQWRLICPPLEHLGTGGNAKRPPAGNVRPGGSSGGPRVTSKQAGAAIASARRIVQILNDFDQDPDVAAEFAAVAPNGKRNIPWSEFCRGRGDVDQLAQALVDGTAAAIPHAVWGPVSTADAVGRNLDSYVVMYVARNPVHIEGRPVRLRVAVRSNRPDWIGATTRSGQVLGYGYWKLFPNDLAEAREKGWIELQLWVQQPWQVARWGTDNTTVDLPQPRRAVRPQQPKASPAPTPAPPPSVVETNSLASETSGPEPVESSRASEQGLTEHPQEAPQAPAEGPGGPGVPSAPPLAPPPPAQPPAAIPPLPPFPPPGPAEDGRRSALSRWLHSVRRSRRR